VDTHTFLLAERQTVVAAALASLRGRYATADRHEVEYRLEAFYDLIAESVERRELTRLLTYTGRVARERFSAGYDLSEVQTAFNVLEEALWRRIFAALPAAEIAETVGLVATAFGAAKDTLGREWVSLATERHVPSLDVSALFAGTERSVASA
jgi:hypothetical protein